MGERDQAAQQHQPHISSLVVRLSLSDGGNGGRGDGGRAGGASDYEPGEVRHEPLSHTRSDRYKDDPGHGNRAASGSPVRRVGGNHRYGPDLDHSSGPTRAREFGGRRDHASRFRDRDSSPVYGRARPGGRSFDRGLDEPGYGRAPVRRGDGASRNNNPNVRPREGDWLCPDPMCRNLNFARREYCNNCKRHRYAPAASPPRRGYQAAPPPPLLPPRRYPGPPIDLSPRRDLNGYRSPPRREWGRDAPRDFALGSGLPPPRHHDVLLRDRERLDYPDDDFRGRSRLDRIGPVDWGHGERGRDRHLGDVRKGYYDRRLLPQSPPLTPPAAGGRLPPQPEGRWGRDGRERSRSPPVRGRGGGVPRRDGYDERGRDERRGGMGRGRVGGAY